MNRENRRTNALVSLHALALIAGLASCPPTAHADDTIDDFGYGFFTNCGGSQAYLTGPVRYVVTGGDNGTPGDTLIATDIYFTGKLNFVAEYTSTDIGLFDRAFYQVNSGPRMYFADNSNQGPKSASISVTRGDTVRYGVETFDGIAGPGILTLTTTEGVACMDDFAGSCGWSFDNPKGGGSGTPPTAQSPVLKVTGGNQGVEESSHYYMSHDFPFEAQAYGQYFSSDTGLWDAAYVVQGPVFFYDEFKFNQNQGTFFKYFSSSGGSIDFPAWWGFGVHTIDGLGGPGNIEVTGVFMDAWPARATNLVWDEQPGPGSIAFPGGNLIDIVGGNNQSGQPSDTFVSAKPNGHYTIEMAFDYSSPDTGDWDYCYYEINGVRTKVTNNSAQTKYYARFDVCCGDTFSLGVYSKDNFGGAGTATIRYMRAWPQVDCTKPPPPCYPDCDGSGSLAIDDFICFQTLFAIGDPSADCDASGSLSIDDFICFQTFFAIGC